MFAGAADWPIRLTGMTPAGTRVLLRPLARSDRQALIRVRRVNAAWLTPWDPTTPPGGAARIDVAKDFAAYRRGLHRAARQGTTVPMVVVVEGRLVGQVMVNSIVAGAFRSGTIGYWISADMAGRWVTPTAVAMLADHLMSPAGRHLHRLEINIQPNNAASLAVPRKLGFRDEGVRERYLHIDGGWRDHRSFALVAEDLDGETVSARLSRAYQQSLARHTE